jgi:flagellar M-ring protein FliF
MDQIRTTTEDVLPAASRSGLQATGVVVREREVLRDTGATLDTKVADTGSSRGGSAQRDVEYAVGRRVEQVVSQPGSIRRVQVVAVVRKALDAAQEDQLRRVIAAAVGASIERGDTVVVQSLANGALLGNETVVATAASAGDPTALGGSAASPAAAGSFYKEGPSLWQWLVAGVLLALLALLLLRAGRRGMSPRGTGGGAPLSEAERAAALRRVRDWMRDTAPAPAAGGPTSGPGAGMPATAAATRRST